MVGFSKLSEAFWGNGQPLRLPEPLVIATPVQYKINNFDSIAPWFAYSRVISCSNYLYLKYSRPQIGHYSSTL